MKAQEMNTSHQKVLDFAMEMIIERSKSDSLQEKVISMDVKYEDIGITWRNKDKSIFIMMIKANDDPRTIENAKIKIATLKYSEEEFKKITL